MQEALLRAWRRAPGWVPVSRGGPARFGTWLARVAVNLAIDSLRRRPHLPLGHAAEQADPARIAIALTYDEGLSNAEAAGAMATTVGAFELKACFFEKSSKKLLDGCRGLTG